MTNPAGPRKLDPAKLEAIHSLFADLPESVAERQSALQDIRQVFHEELAAAFEDSLNRFAAGLPHDSKEAKERNASHINGALRSVGLSIRDPKSGRPATLVVDTQDGEHPQVARYRLETRDEAGRVRRSLASRHGVPPLTLMPSAPWKEFWARRSRERGELGR